MLRRCREEMGSWQIWRAGGVWISVAFRKQYGKVRQSNGLARKAGGTSSSGRVVGKGWPVWECWLRKSGWIMLIRVSIGVNILNVISGYAPQVGREIVEKEEFWLALSKIVDEIGQEEFVVIGGDMNGHVGAKADGYEGVHGGKGYGERNTEGEMLLEFADAMKLVVLNTWFTKNAPKKVTYESGGNKTVVDYMLVRKCDLAKITDINVIGSEECVQQHKLLVCKIGLHECVKKRKKKFVGRYKVWRLKEAAIRKDFADGVKYWEERRGVGDLESMWKGLKDCLLEETETVGGKTKGRARHKITWWWNKDTDLAVKEKRRAYVMWKESGSDVDKGAYKLAKS